MEEDTNGNGSFDPGETCGWTINTHSLTCPSDDIDCEYRTYGAEHKQWYTEVGAYDSLDWSKGGRQW